MEIERERSRLVHEAIGDRPTRLFDFFGSDQTDSVRDLFTALWTYMDQVLNGGELTRLAVRVFADDEEVVLSIAVASIEVIEVEVDEVVEKCLHVMGEDHNAGEMGFRMWFFPEEPNKNAFLWD